MQEQKLQKQNQLKVEDKNQEPDDHIIDQKEFLSNQTELFENSGFFETTFVCLLVPRFEEHILIGDLSERLHTWMRDICISYGWNLKFIEISPNYLHWVMTVPINTPPPEFMKIVQNTTSEKIFDEFPRFSTQNTSK